MHVRPKEISDKFFVVSISTASLLEVVFRHFLVAIDSGSRQTPQVRTIFESLWAPLAIDTPLVMTASHFTGHWQLSCHCHCQQVQCLLLFKQIVTSGYSLYLPSFNTLLQSILFSIRLVCFNSLAGFKRSLRDIDFSQFLKCY